MSFLVIGIGGFIGSNLRHLVSVLCVRLFGSGFPFGTFVVNAAGCFLLGFLLAFGAESAPVSERVKEFVATGFLGALTTFSTFSMESLTLFRDGAVLLALVNVCLNLVAGLLAAVGGVWLARLSGG